MRNIDIQEAFETEVNLVNDGIAKPLSVDSEYFLNSALQQFATTRYTGMNSKLESFEQTQKRIDDLRNLVIYVKLTAIGSGDQYTISIPNNYMYLLGTTAQISPADGLTIDCWPVDSNGNYIIKNTDPIEGTIDTVDRIKDNSLSEYHLHYTKARPIKVQKGSEILFYTDGNYKVNSADIQYMRYPVKIDLHTSPYSEYSDIPQHAILEVIKLAAKLYIENKMDARYNTISNEISTME